MKNGPAVEPPDSGGFHEESDSKVDDGNHQKADTDQDIDLKKGDIDFREVVGAHQPMFVNKQNCHSQ